MRKLYVCEGEIVWSQVKLIENTDRLNSNRGSIRFKIDTIRAGAECSRGGEHKLCSYFGERSVNRF